MIIKPGDTLIVPAEIILVRKDGVIFGGICSIDTENKIIKRYSFKEDAAFTGEINQDENGDPIIIEESYKTLKFEFDSKSHFIQWEDTHVVN